MDVVGFGQPKAVPTGLKRPYSADPAEKQPHVLNIVKHDKAVSIVPSLKDLVGFTAPRDFDDTNYTRMPSHSMHQEETSKNTVLRRYQSALPCVAGHTMTNSTSIGLPELWFGPSANAH